MRNPWVAFSAIYLASIVAIINQYKVPPLMGELMMQIHVNTTMAGWLMSVFALAGIILAFPSVGILRKLGPTKGGVIGLTCIIAGCIVGGVATSAMFLMTGRVIEGAGLTLIAVISPSVIAMSFKPEKVSLSMGIWATWYPVGSAIAYNIAHPVTGAFGGWRASWWLGAILAIIALVIYAIIVKKPAEQGAVQGHGRGHGSGNFSFAVGFKTPRIWLLGLAFCFMMYGSLSFLTWAPTYLNEFFGIPKMTANSYSSLGFLTSIPSGVIAGWLLNKSKNRDKFLVACSILSAVTYTFAYLIPLEFIVPYLLVIGLITGFTAATVFAIAPGVMPSPALIGLGMGILTIMRGTANLLATPATGFFIKDGNWTNAVLPMAVVLILGVICSIAYYKLAPKPALIQ